MKKKYRNITVNGIEYAWNAIFDGDGEGGVSITIWQNKKTIFHEHYTNGLYHLVTPATIEYIIKHLHKPKFVVCTNNCKCNNFITSISTDNPSTKDYCKHLDAHLFYDECKTIGCVSIEEGLKL